jgi:twitching motility protein PilT
VLDRLVKATIKAGGHALKLIPGRRMVVVTSTGEWEVQGEVQSAAAIEKILVPVLPPGGRERLLQGPAEWEIELPAIGPVHLLAAPVADGLKAIVTLSGESAAGTAEAPTALHAGPSATIALGAEWSGEVEELLRKMPELGASDLHLSVGSPPMFRHDGEMRALAGVAPLAAGDVEKMLATLIPDRNRAEFERRNDTDFAHEIAGVARFRCNVFRDRRGVGAVLRIIPTRILTAEEMGLSPEIMQLCQLPKGLVLVTGPTGSGKSTTLAALVDFMNRNRSDHIITIEDPIEFVHENKRCLVNQRQVVEHTGSFRDALRAALREDPDIVLVGEMRDLETVAIAIETAETGHLVFGTLHTSSAPSTVDRIIDQFPADRQAQIRVMLAESLKGVISQTLCRRVGGGRVPAFEVLIVIPAISNLIREGKVFQIPSIMQTGKRYGMCQMNESLLELVRRKLVEPQEAYARAVDKSGLVAMLRRAGVETSWLPAEASQ